MKKEVCEDETIGRNKIQKQEWIFLIPVSVCDLIFRQAEDGFVREVPSL